MSSTEVILSLAGDRIRKLRKKKGITQEKLGKELKVKKSSISHYENATGKPSLDSLIRICECLNTDMNSLLGMNVVGKCNNKEIILSDEEARLIIALRNTKSYRNMILRPEKYAQLIELRIADYSIKW